MALGRISGPLLKSNLLRNGVDLAFENDLLYLDVTNRRIGINTGTPSHELQVNGTTRSTTLTVTGSSTLGLINFTTNTITSTNDQINVIAGGSNPVVYQGKLQVGDLQLTSNVISTLQPNQDIVLTTTGTGAVVVNSNLTVNGNFYTQGNMTVDGIVTIKGNITIGDATTDTIAITAGINSDLIPDTQTFLLTGSSISNTTPGVLTLQTRVLSGVTITGTSGQFSCTSTSPALYVGQELYISGIFAGSGGISGYANAPKTYYIIATNGTTTFQLSATNNGSPVGTVVGTPTGLTYAPYMGFPLQAGMWLTGGNVTPGTYLASGSGNTWTLNQAATGVPTVATLSYNLGSPSKTWKSVFSNIANFDNINVTNFENGNLRFSDNTITNIVPNANINFNTTGTGGIIVGNIRFNANNITNVVANAVTTFNSRISSASFLGTISGTTLTVSGIVGTMLTGMTILGSGVVVGTYIISQLSGTTGGDGTYEVSETQTLTPAVAMTGSVSGYVSIGGTNGFVIPAGTTAQRAGQPVAGMMRFNTDPTSQAVEIFTGSSWLGVAGVSAGISINQASDIAAQWALTLG